nr:MAG TPA: hypothetical protein [Bacteriophage sp.]
MSANFVVAYSSSGPIRIDCTNTICKYQIAILNMNVTCKPGP